MLDRPPPSGPVRVAVVAADRRVRSGLTSLLAASGAVTVSGSAGSVADALPMLRSRPADVIVVDRRLAEPTPARDVVAGLRSAAPGARILVLRWQDVVDRAPDDGGADGVLDAALQPSALLDAIVAGPVSRRRAAPQAAV